MRANYKFITDIDLSSNNLYNISKIIGNDYDVASVSKDLEITTQDKASPGNLLLRAGQGDTTQTGGYVHLYAGYLDEPDNYGIFVRPNNLIDIIDDNINLLSNDTTDGEINFTTKKNANDRDSVISIKPDTIDITSTYQNLSSLDTVITTDNNIDIISKNTGNIDVTQELVIQVGDPEKVSQIFNNENQSISFDSTIFSVVARDENANIEFESESEFNVHSNDRIDIACGIDTDSRIIFNPDAVDEHRIQIITGLLDIDTENITEDASQSIKITTPDYKLASLDIHIRAGDDTQDGTLHLLSGIPSDEDTSKGIILQPNSNIELDSAEGSIVSKANTSFDVTVGTSVLNILPSQTDFVTDTYNITNQNYNLESNNFNIHSTKVDAEGATQFRIQVTDDLVLTQTQNLKVNKVANFDGFTIYWDDTLNSLIFAQGESAWQ